MSTNNKWEALSMKDRAFLIREAVRNGITDINYIKEMYNDEGRRIKLGVPYRTFEAGSDYDYYNAAPENMPKSENDHWSSRNPHTGQILKSPNHSTYNLAIEGEESVGYEIQKIGDREYSFPKGHRFSGENNGPERPFPHMFVDPYGPPHTLQMPFSNTSESYMSDWASAVKPATWKLLDGHPQELSNEYMSNVFAPIYSRSKGKHAYEVADKVNNIVLNTPVKYTDTLPDNVGGRYSARSNTIQIASDLDNITKYNVGVHEKTHAIDDFQKAGEPFRDRHFPLTEEEYQILKEAYPTDVTQHYKNLNQSDVEYMTRKEVRAINNEVRSELWATWSTMRKIDPKYNVSFEQYINSLSNKALMSFIKSGYLDRKKKISIRALRHALKYIAQNSEENLSENDATV